MLQAVVAGVTTVLVKLGVGGRDPPKMLIDCLLASLMTSRALSIVKTACLHVVDGRVEQGSHRPFGGRRCLAPQDIEVKLLIAASLLEMRVDVRHSYSYAVI